MSDPFTIALLLGTGVAAAGQIQAGRHARAEAKSAQSIANYNAAVQEQEAKAIEQKSRFEQIRQAKAAERIKGRLRAELAASGARTDVGTPLLLAEEQAAELELESYLIGYEARTGARRARTQAEIDIAQGKIYKERARQAMPAAYTKAGKTLLTGFGTASRRSYETPEQTDIRLARKHRI